ncbi:MAG: uroporphyrinogen decarboxylase [Sulfobacillus thermotolerans]|uniref:Uroporphyrinogen decarboxylase n=1 Tax=Sulfobacillus thermotolerans TaxID=338644 RepID=A0ABM6RPY4_9FIRM|nr:uroporphyrinogen decarboxylase [Sulfobacillus thermotolerans]MCY0908559.1 uroporphyrinogen decarboxylase [Sulfobacillus thermotolerans]
MISTSRFIEACWGRPHDKVPVWFMRQAGRYQDGYRKLRQQYSFLEMAHNPDICTEVSCRPVEELGVDAAILFSDIMIPLGPMGVDFEIREHFGPVIAHPVRTGRDLKQLRVLEPEDDLPEVFEAIEKICERLGAIPLIGFAGAPFTLASYLIEGGPSKNYLHTKRLMWEQPEVWRQLMDVLADATVRHLSAQVRHGAQAVQVFDSWIGALPVDDYRKYVMPSMRAVFAKLNALQVPTIYFGTGTASLLHAMKETGPTVLGVDWRTPIRQARSTVGSEVTLQGNLDPMTLVCEWDIVKEHSTAILQDMLGDPAFIFNLGHGVPPEAHPDNLKRLVEWVHQFPGTPASQEVADRAKGASL